MGNTVGSRVGFAVGEPVIFVGPLVSGESVGEVGDTEGDCEGDFVMAGVGS